jgi:hypothetical protein
MRCQRCVVCSHTNQLSGLEDHEGTQGNCRSTQFFCHGERGKFKLKNALTTAIKLGIAVDGILPKFKASVEHTRSNSNEMCQQKKVKFCTLTSVTLKSNNKPRHSVMYPH